MAFPTGNETGSYLAIDMGGTNLRVCEVRLSEEKGKFDMVQSKYRMPAGLKTGTGEELWAYLAECIQQFVEQHHAGEKISLPLGFTFSYPATQDYIDHGVLQRWTKGFDVSGVEGEDVVPQFEAALQARGVPIKLTALVNDTVGTLIAGAYTDTAIKIGAIFGTGCNAAYMDTCGGIPKLAHLGLDPDLPMTINCEWGAFDNEHFILPRTPYDIIIDEQSPRPGQQTFEKMIAGLYLGELFRLILLELYEAGKIFVGQDASGLKEAYQLDSDILAAIEADETDDLSQAALAIQKTLNLKANLAEVRFCRRIAELIGTRAARLCACGISAICKKAGYESCHVGADGGVFLHYAQFKPRATQALGEILDWDPNLKEKPVELVAAEDGSGVGAALIAALTIKRVKEGINAGIRDPEALLAMA